MKRKLWIIVLMMLSGGLGVCVQFSPSQLGDIILIGISRLFNTVAFALFSLISAETFPTSIRSTGLGVSEAMSNFGNMGAPFLVTFALFEGVKAVFVGGFLNLAGGLSMCIVKETKLDPVAKKEETLLSEG